MSRAIALFTLMMLLSTAIVPSNGTYAEVDGHTEVPPWWERTTMDRDLNGIDDDIDEALETDPEVLFDIYVHYSHRPTWEDITRLKGLGLTIGYVCKYIDVVVVDDVPASVIGTVGDLADVVMIEEQPIYRTNLDVSTRQMKARPSTEYSDVWDQLGVRGDGINIAIVDTGVDDGHESLAGKFIAGVDFTNAFGARDGTDNPDDRNGHGTHCAGIAMGTGGDEGTYKGVAPDSMLIDVKVLTDTGAGGYLIQGIEWCIEHRNDEWGDGPDANDGIDILSISIGGFNEDDDGQGADSLAANEAVQQGLVVVAGIGNDGNNHEGISSPAAGDLVIAVGAIDDFDTVDRSDDEIATYSNSGPRADDGDEDHMDELKPEVVAPGTDIVSANFVYIGQDSTGYVTQSGTSMATPHVSGLAALMMQADPDLAPLEIKEMMMETAEGRGEPYDPELSERYNQLFGWGMIDAYLAVSYASGNGNGGVVDDSIECSITSPQANVTLDGSVNITGTASISSGEIDHVEVWWNDLLAVQANPEEEDWTNWYIEFDTEDFEDGEHSIGARAVSGPRASEDFMINVTVDNSGPEDDDDDDGFLGMPPVSPFIALPIAMLAFALRKRR